MHPQGLLDHFSEPPPPPPIQQKCCIVVFRNRYRNMRTQISPFPVFMDEVWILPVTEILLRFFYWEPTKTYYVLKHSIFILYIHSVSTSSCPVSPLVIMSSFFGLFFHKKSKCLPYCHFFPIVSMSLHYFTLLSPNL
jgi:hypothetical protein